MPAVTTPISLFSRSSHSLQKMTVVIIANGLSVHSDKLIENVNCITVSQGIDWIIVNSTPPKVYLSVVL